MFTCLNVVVCLEHEVQVSVNGCDISLSLCLYLQMHTFERFEYQFLPQCNWCWNQHSDMSLQSAAQTDFGESIVHYRYVYILWRPWTYIVFYNYGICYSYSRFITDHKGPPLDRIVSRYNSAYIFIMFSLVLRSIACCSQIHPIIITTHIFKYLDSDPLCFPQYSIFFIGLPALIFPCRIKFRNLLLWFFFIIFSVFLFLKLKLCL
jgi:hypothetical protein